MPETHFVEGCARGFVELEGGDEVVREVSRLLADLVTAEVAHSGGVRLSIAFEVRQRLIERDRRPITAAHAVPWHKKSEPLTPAQERVLRYLVTNLDYRAIGQRLNISRNTVKSHAKVICEKFGVSSRDEAVVVAQELGLVPRYWI
jgi:DNA-binding CsgD family transcriptional regulator